MCKTVTDFLEANYFFESVINYSQMALFAPVKVYDNFYSDRAEIRNNHKNVPAIYMFTHVTDSSKTYIGQSSHLTGRINNYLNQSFLLGHKNSNSPFIKALLKYGPSSFTFSILEYVSVEELGPREIH